MTVSEAEASYSAGPTSAALMEETIGEVLRRIAADHGAQEAVTDASTGERLTYTELLDRVEEVARACIALGLERGDRVGVWGPNTIEWLILQYATAYVGIIMVNINPAYRTSELEYALRQSGCRAVFAANEFKGSDYPVMVEKVRVTLPGLKHAVYFGSRSWSDFLARSSECPPNRLAQAVDTCMAEDPINIQYTSGTTGFPKGATLSHYNILNNAHFVGEGCGYSPTDRICVPVPFYHCFGMVLGNLAALTHGATIVIPGPSFDPAETLRAVSEESCTALYGVPTMFIAELALEDFEEFDLGSLRTGIMAGSPCPVDTMRRVISEMNIAEVTICYGMTETSPVSTQTLRDDSEERRVDSVGQVHPHVEVQIVEPDTGEVVPRGTAGEFRTRGYSVMLGYWNDPERTKATVDDDGWMRTGDLAVMDESGYLNIVGRIKDMIIRGGQNIYPQEIEEFLLGHGQIEDVQVIGVPDATYGEIIMAWIQPVAGEQLSAEVVREFCQGSIAHFKIPSLIEFTSEFPQTITGKIQKYKLREMAVELFNLQTEDGRATA